MRDINDWINAFPKDDSIYPQNCFYELNGKLKDGVPFSELTNIIELKEIQYFESIEKLLKQQSFTSRRRGADLPFFGDKYFSNEKGIRVMMITQDSKAKDAGSIVFFGPLLTIDMNKERYSDFRKNISSFISPRSFNYRSYTDSTSTLREWGILPSFFYITDAKKVYNFNSNSFDVNKSIELVRREIETTTPDIIVLAGEEAFSVAKSIANYSGINHVGEMNFKINDIPVVSAPFMTGNGRTGSNKDIFPIKSEKTKVTLKKLYTGIAK